MVRVKPFAALRPPKNIVAEVAAPPYDVLDSAEAAALAGSRSLLHITRPEIDFTPPAGEHEERSYARAVENFARWQSEGWLKRDSSEHYYVYAQTMDGRTQFGIVLCAHTDDYSSGAIKRHEFTRKAKEDDRMKHVRIQNANVEPVFLAYRDNAELDSIVAETVAQAPEYDFADEHGFRHRLWVVDGKRNDGITAIFGTRVDSLYVADGHHRTAAAARVGAERRDGNPAHDGTEEYNYFLAVCFPQSQLKVMDYNRLVRDLAGMGRNEFLDALKRDFAVEAKGALPYRPAGQRNFSMYLEGEWYSLTLLPGHYETDDVVDSLDVSILGTLVLDRILGIKDLRTDGRIDFSGGIRGLEELRSRVDSGEMKVAFALAPVTMKQIFDIADSGRIMPPKTTWFEPKLRSGLTIHTLE